MLHTDPFTRHASYTLWRLEANRIPGKKPLKVPVHYDGTTHHSLGNPRKNIPPNPAPPLTAEKAEGWLQHNRRSGIGHDRPGEVGYIGVGFRPVGTSLACLDIDDCLVNGVPNTLAASMIAQFPGALLETSHSGRGLHIWFTYTGESPGRRGKDKSGQLELYSEGQFIAAGTLLSGSALVDHTAQMQAVLARYWPPRPAQSREVTAVDWLEKTEDERERIKSEILSAARHVPQDSYDQWTSIGAALVSLGDEGLPLWHEISSWDDQYDYDSTEAKWYQLAGDRTDYRAIIAKAQNAGTGWINPRSTTAKIAAAMAGFGAAGLAPGAVATLPEPRPTASPTPAAQMPPSAAPAPIAQQVAAFQQTFMAAAAGVIPATLVNIVNALTSKEGGSIVAFDQFLGRPVISDAGRWRPITDGDLATLRVQFEERGFKSVPADIMKHAVTAVCERVKFDSAIEWAESLVWDGVPRVAESLIRYYRTKDTPYTRACAEYLWTALAGRCLQPGCQADMALILIGLQGARKTSAVAALAPFPSGFGKVNLGKRDEDLSRRMKGKMVMELPELRGLSGRDVQGIRDWMTTRDEAFVDKYQSYESVYARRFVAVGTSNEDEVLDDAEGERRWLPARVGAVDVEALEADRDQLWAEGIAMWRAGGVRWQAAEQLARDEHAEFKVGDEWTDAVVQWLNSPANSPGGTSGSQFMEGSRGDHPVRVSDVLTYALHVPLERINPAAKLRVTKILKSINYGVSISWIGGRATRQWSRRKG